MQTKQKVKSKLDQLKKEDSKYLSGNTLTKEDILQCLQSQSNAQILNALKRLLALSILGKSISKYTSKIIAQLANGDIEIKRLCYYLLSEISYQQPDCDELLMCISPLHKTMTTPNVPSVVKGDTLKTLCTLSISEMKPMLVATLQRLHVDKSPYVKKIAALNLLHLQQQQSGENSDVDAADVTAFFKHLLRDAVYLRAVVIHLSKALEEKENEAEQEITNPLDYMHFYFRKVCSELHTYPYYDIVQILSLFHKYARLYLHREQTHKSATEDANNSSSSTSVVSAVKSKQSKQQVHSDIALLISTCTRLLYSSNPAVVIEVAHIAAEFPQTEFLAKTAKALLRMVSIHSESKLIVLQAIEQLALKHPQYFRNSYRSLYINQHEKGYNKVKKISILLHLVDESNVSAILEELNYQVRSPLVEVSIAAINCVQSIALKHPTKYFGRCIKSLTALLKTSSGKLIDTLTSALCDLLQVDIKQYYPILTYMFGYISQVKQAMVRERIVGQLVACCQEIPTICADYYRQLLIGFREENDGVKLQIGRLGFKLTKVIPQTDDLYATMAKLFEYNVQLAQSDRSFKVRDSIRLIAALSRQHESSESHLTVDFSAEFTAKILLLSNNDAGVSGNSSSGVEQEGAPSTNAGSVHAQNNPSGLLVTADGFRIGSVSSLARHRVSGYAAFEVTSICTESTDDRRGEMALQESKEKVQLAEERANRERLREEKQAAESKNQQAGGVSAHTTQPPTQPITATSKTQNKQVQKDLLNHYQDSLQKTLNDFFED